MIRTLRRARVVLVTASLLVAALAITAGAATATTTAAGATTPGTTPTVATTPGTTTSTTTTPATTPPGAVTYGLSDAQGPFAHCTDATPYCCDPDTAHCDPASMQGDFENPLFQRLTTPASQHRISELRLFVSYDALQEWNGSVSAPGCVYSRALRQPWYDLAGRLHSAGESWRGLLAGLIEAHADGLTPVLSISGYASPHAKPAWDQPAPDPTTVGGSWEYRCGLQGVLDAVGKLPTWEQPHIWEPFNEPDGYRILRSFTGEQTQSCAVSTVGQINGAAKAACLYVAGAQEIHQFAGHAQDTVIAGTFVHPAVPYLDDYAAQIARQLPGAAYPSIWSVHDYVDVTAAYAGPVPTQLAPFDQALATDSGGRAHELWVTEAGTVLTSQRKGGDCPAIGPDPEGSLGACVNGQPSRQATSADAFFALAGSATAVPITHLFWYQFQSAPNWDSGLVDAAGRPRAAWCAYYGSGACTGDPNAA